MRNPIRLAVLRTVVLALLLSLLAPHGVPLAPALARVPTVGPVGTVPRVAIHVSELTLALAAGDPWWPAGWPPFTGYQALEEALRSDGTPFEEISDAQIRSGWLLQDGKPRYPILFSLASAAVADEAIAPLRDYVRAGGFLFAGSSAFTRNPDGTPRGDFALAEEMGLHTATPGPQNWYLNGSFAKLLEHRLVSHLPPGTVVWAMPSTPDRPPLGSLVTGYGSSSSSYFWRVQAMDATVIATGAEGPLLATKLSGAGRYLYYGALQPLVGHSGFDAGMYAYVLFRRAIEWAFESAHLPLVKLSPWPYGYDAAMVFRHDLENSAREIWRIEGSAAFEQQYGVKGDYYFTTGVLRSGSEDTQLTEQMKAMGVAGLRRAVQRFGATIGSHNGGLPNPNGSVAPLHYYYWHWGPDEALEATPPGYPDGATYAAESIGRSFQDIEGWLAGLDNGRPGCAAAGDCPRLWAAPFFNSIREGSHQILAGLGVAIVGEQKVGPFPHWPLSTQTPGRRYPQLTLPVSDWFVDGRIAQSLEGHNSASLRSAVDFYYDLGALINLYAHTSSARGLPAEYVAYAAAKPRVWKTNAVGVYDWWRARSGAMVDPTFSRMGSEQVIQATLSGATDPETAVEVAIPGAARGEVGDLSVYLDGHPAEVSAYRATAQGVKVRLGMSATRLEVRYTRPPRETWTQADGPGGPDQALWAGSDRYPPPRAWLGGSSGGSGRAAGRALVGGGLRRAR